MYDDQVISKFNSEVINCYIDFAAWLNTGQSLSSITSVESSGDETISDISISGTKVLLTISGGTCGDKIITAIVTTSDEETLVAKVKLRNR